MSSVSIQGNASGTGIFTIASPNSNTNRTLTLPDATGTINTSGAVNEVPAGSASAPSIYPAGDTNTGIFFPAADTIAFAEGGTEAMRIDSSGNVGIGSASPTTYVDGSRGLVIETSSGRSGLTFVGNHSTADEILGRINFTDSGSTNTSYRNAIIDGIRGANDNSAYLVFSTSNSGSAAERMRITSDGKFLVNETAQLAGYNQQATITCSGSNVLALALKASGSGNIALATTSTDTSTYNAAVFANNGNFSGALKGSISVSNSATTYNTTSDYRLKENIAPMTGALATVAQLKPCTYTWKDGGEIGQGFIAHELQAVVPDCVTGEKDAVDADGKPIYQGVDTSFLVATLTAAIQELKAELDSTKARLAALEAQ